MITKTKEHVEDKPVDPEQVATAIDALIEGKLDDPAFRRQLRVWGEQTPHVATKLATRVLESRSRFFTPVICRWVVRGSHNPLAVQNAAELLVAIGAADKGPHTTWRHGDTVHYTPYDIFYLKLDVN